MAPRRTERPTNVVNGRNASRKPLDQIDLIEFSQAQQALEMALIAPVLIALLLGVPPEDLPLFQQHTTARLDTKSSDEEKAQAFGTQARKFTGDMVFQQTVTVSIRNTDQYGRLNRATRH